MPAHQIPYRQVAFTGGGPAFPADVEIYCDLVLHELFGESDQSGKLHLVQVGQTPQLVPDLMHGGVRKRGGGRLPRVIVDTVFFDFRLQLQGTRATISGRASDISSFQNHIHTVANNLPSFIASALKEPVEIERLTGQVGGKPFKVDVLGK